MSNLVHVNKIEMVSVADLSSLKIVGSSTCRLSAPPIFEEIHIYELVDVLTEETYENNQKVFTTTATFKTCDKVPSVARQVAFRLTSIDGNRYMIGTGERPYPIIKEKNPFPGKPGESTLKTVTISWKSLTPMLLIEE